MKETDENGVESIREVTNQKEIEWEVRKRYWKLYRKEATIIDKNNILERIGDVKKMSAYDKENLEKEITMEEVSKTLKNTRNNVAPGAGRFTGFFYKDFWVFLKIIVLGAIFENKELPLTARLGIIALILKGDMDRCYISNWRPLTLLDTLYKLLSSILAYRLKPTLDRFLGHEQKAYIPVRFILKRRLIASVLNLF